MPTEIENKIAAILPPHSDNGSDTLSGAGGNCTSFSVANMYYKLRGFDMEAADPIWSKLWKLQVSERVRCFVWRMKWDRLLTNSMKHRMGLSSAACNYCGLANETILHALRDCSLVNQFWQQVVPYEIRGETYRNAMSAMEKVGQRDKVLSHIQWQQPVGNYVKLNTDGSCKEGKRAGCGGVIRGNQGEWLGGFAKGVGQCSAFVAELWGVLEGLLLAKRLGFSTVELSIDSKAVVHVVISGRTQGADGYAIVKKIRRLLKMDWNVKILHEYREANKCADALANIGCNLDHEVIFYEACPMEIGYILLADQLGISTPRLIVA
ncbi:ribonuclease H [Trifolium pratense]|uniref:Ribonuclease H n=1 Tax=Trifolium pratense TaxID=57577 RepID=A0A2K3MXN9_TRIPR|nr:ribonuclease H [Trifolium pratense]